MDDDRSNADSVSTTVELVGEYEEIAAILGRNATSVAELEALTADVERVLEIVGRTGGTTKSGLVEELPPGLTADLDADSVIHVLRVLALYDLVTLDGNTWRPGPAFSRE